MTLNLCLLQCLSLLVLIYISYSCNKNGVFLWKSSHHAVFDMKGYSTTTWATTGIIMALSFKQRLSALFLLVMSLSLNSNWDQTKSQMLLFTLSSRLQMNRIIPELNTTYILGIMVAQTKLLLKAMATLKQPMSKIWNMQFINIHQLRCTKFSLYSCFVLIVNKEKS